MPDKSFDQVIPFHSVTTQAGATYWFPLVMVTFIQSTGLKVSLPLLFDTGASTTTLRSDLFPVLEVPSWDSGQATQVETAGDAQLATTYRYENVTLELLGKRIVAPVDLMELPVNPLYNGLLGREVVFEHFGFGFWEPDHELLVANNP